MDLYCRIDEMRKRKAEIQGRKIPDSTLCKEVGVSQGAFGDLKHGRTKTLSMDSLAKFANYFGCSVGELVGESAEPVDDALEILRENPDTRTLLHDGKYLNKEQIAMISQLMRQMRRGNNDSD